MPLKDRLFDRDVTIIRSYGDTDYCKITTLKTCRKSGVVDDSVRSPPSADDGKLLQSLSRAKRVVFEYCMCNTWDYFFTGTFDKTKVRDRYDLDYLHKSVSKFLKAYNRKYGCSVKYVLVPERHKDGAYHFHGVLYGVPFEHLHKFCKGDTMSSRIAKLVLAGESIFDWTSWSQEFGFTTLSPIKDRIACAHYITKYLTKSFDDDICLYGHLYYCSRGLKKADVIAKGHLEGAQLEYTYVTDYCHIKQCDIEYAKLIKEFVK